MLKYVEFNSALLSLFMLMCVELLCKFLWLAECREMKREKKSLVVFDFLVLTLWDYFWGGGVEFFFGQLFKFLCSRCDFKTTPPF
jgi:hypothetical protein